MHPCYAPSMATDQILALLIAERDKLDLAIQALQGSARRHRLNNANDNIAPRRRRGMSDEARKAQSARMKAYWAKRRKQAAKQK